MATHSSVLAWRIPGTGAWWAAVYGVAQSRTRLKRLSSSSSSYCSERRTLSLLPAVSPWAQHRGYRARRPREAFSRHPFFSQVRGCGFILYLVASTCVESSQEERVAAFLLGGKFFPRPSLGPNYKTCHSTAISA